VTAKSLVGLAPVLVLTSVLAASLPATGAGQAPAVEPLLRVVDLNVGERAEVELANGKTVTVKLLDLEEKRDTLRNAVREARVTVEVDGRKATLVAAFYRLPTTVGEVQIDCAVTKGCVQEGKNPWALEADARLRLWPADSPWIHPGTFTYPAVQRWFASDTQMANDPVHVDGGEIPANKSIYYHWGLDIGGAEGLVDVLAATDGVVISAGEDVLDSEEDREQISPRYDVIYLRDARGWYYRYSHLHSIEPWVEPGVRMKQGRKIGVLGKEGGSGGWSHLHFDVKGPQPSGRYGIIEGYAFLWQAYHAERGTKLQAVARPHHVAWTGDEVTLDGSRSWSSQGPGHIKSYEWTLSDGTTATGAKVTRRYDRSGMYSEILKVTDDEGRIDYDFAVVQVVDQDRPDEVPPSIHAVYWPTFDIQVADPVTFKVRSFRIGPDEGHELWDFGDGSPTVQVQSDGNAVKLAEDGYAVTTHRYERPGHYLVSVQRTNDRGQTATARLHVRVGPR
jgi:murein DD-endopeptidase MepM/ murein hydrolase activator NlpD